MAKINHFMIQYKELISQINLPLMDDSLPTPVVHRFVHIFTDIDDSRCSGMTRYPLPEILLTAFLAVLANASTWIEIEQFGHEKESWLKKFMPFVNGTPSHDTFRRVFSLIDSSQLQKATVSFLIQNVSAIRDALADKSADDFRLICVDGKEENATGRNYGTSEEIRNLQTLHVYDASSEICLFSSPIDSKTNEIPVAHDILQTMNLKGCIVTFDALHTQRNTISVICASKGDYVGGLKENQSGLCEDARLTFTDETMERMRKTKGYFLEQTEKAHGQIEKRRYYMTRAAFGTSRKQDWKNLRSFVRLEKHTTNLRTSREHVEIRYYITSLTDLDLCAEAIRGHWSIENNLHWHLDYSFKEDDNSTMDKKAFHNLSLLNKMCLSLCRLAQPLMGKSSLRVIRKRFSWNLEENLALLLNSFDDDTLKSALECGGPQKKKG